MTPDQSALSKSSVATGYKMTRIRTGDVQLRHEICKDPGHLDAEATFLENKGSLRKKRYLPKKQKEY